MRGERSDGAGARARAARAPGAAGRGPAAITAAASASAAAGEGHAGPRPAAATPDLAAPAVPLDAATRACFLDQLALLGCPARAAAAVGIAPVSAYALRRRSARFAAAWRDALAIGYERLEAAALRQLLEHEAPLDLAAAVALLDRHRAAAAGAPVAPPAQRGRRAALGPFGAELARRLQLYAGATPGARRTPVSAAVAAAVDALERDAAADASAAAGVDADAPVDPDAAGTGAGPDVGAAASIDLGAATRIEAGLSRPPPCAPANAGEQDDRAPHVAAPRGSGFPRAREHPSSDGWRGGIHDGPPDAGPPASAVTSAFAIHSRGEAAWLARPSAPEAARGRFAVDPPDAAAVLAALLSAGDARPVDAACPARSDGRPGLVGTRVDASRPFYPGGASPPRATPAARPRVWA
ncbi:hypothetical protein K7957_07545 [Sphingomonas yunnanensis]|uniref:hypothetical protein n=1 Tax=Sphingomonas yunnanensis TaxID=310400 RepID=UPI001CA61FC6|nr:hypothetical protein [Sphingomonas yunnanensis]MBY9062783.1 hypothetical protein [Sphingomonas yunnanensis]